MVCGKVEGEPRKGSRSLIVDASTFHRDGTFFLIVTIDFTSGILIVGKLASLIFLVIFINVLVYSRFTDMLSMEVSTGSHQRLYFLIKLTLIFKSSLKFPFLIFEIILMHFMSAGITATKIPGDSV